jgi:glutathione S-transferase
MIKMYDLAGARDDHRFSPHCWRVRMALAHKGLRHEAVPWRFTEKEAIAFSGQGKVPVLVDDDTVVCDSWAIANYLEDTYPERPLFGCEMARGEALFVKHWTERALQARLVPVLLLDIWKGLHEKDKEYFRRTREERVGMTLEAFCTDREGHIGAFREALAPLRETVRVQPYVSGEAPGFADYLPFGALQWARCTSRAVLVEAADPVHAWQERMLVLFDGLAAKAPSPAAR